MSNKINVQKVTLMANTVKDIPNWFSSYAFSKHWQIGKLKINPSMRRADGYMGRFGGGWNWKLGFMSSGSTIIFSLLIMSIRISWDKGE